MVTGVLATSGRRWGRAGVLVCALLLGACSSTEPVRTARPASRADHPAVAAVTDQAISPPPVVFTGSVPAASSPVLPATVASGTGLWSVVIGIDDYPGSGHDLQYARNDASDVDALLARAGEPAAQRVDLADGQATAATIHRAVRWLVANAGPDSTAVLFYAGHVRKLGPSTEAIVGADGGLVTDTELANDLRDLRAGRTWIVIAGCYGGGFTEALAPGRILTAAAPADQLAYETATYHRSYLGEYLVHRGLLEGLGGPSVQSAFAYATSALRQDHPDRMPVEYDDAAGPLVLGGAAPPRGAPPARPPSTTSTTAPAPGRSSGSSPPPSGQPQRQCIVTAGSLVRCPDN